MLIAANKMDLPGAENNLKLIMEELKEYEIFPISAATGEGLNSLIYRLADLLDEIGDVEEVPQVDEEQLRVVKVEDKPKFFIEREGDIFIVEGPEIDKHWARTNFANEEALNRFLQILDAMGVVKELRKKGLRTVMLYSSAKI